MAKQGLTARRAARDLVTAVTEDRRLLGEAMTEVLEPLAPQDRARAQRLATEAAALGRPIGPADRPATCASARPSRC